jgi:hypothetical protein
MTIADLIEKWFETKKMDKLTIHRFTNWGDGDQSVSCTIRYHHTRLLSAGNGPYFPEWLFYEIIDVSEFEVSYSDIHKVRHTINAHDPEFFEKLEDEINKQIRHIENRTTEAKVVLRNI